MVANMQLSNSCPLLMYDQEKTQFDFEELVIRDFSVNIYIESITDTESWVGRG